MIKYIRKNTWSIVALITLVLFTGFLSNNLLAEDSDDIQWSVTLNFMETSGKTGQSLLGEALNASDGKDGYDVPIPGDPPGGCRISVYFTTSFQYPHENLMEEIKHYSNSNIYKVWNLSVDWIPCGDDQGTNVTISWDIDELYNSEYDFITLKRKGQLNGTWYTASDMLSKNNFSYSHEYITTGSTVLWFLEDKFKIICENYNTPPDIPSEPNGETFGYHGSLYTYSTTTSDPDEDQIYYMFNWDDSNVLEWIGPFNSEEIVSIDHIWEMPGTYNISVKAMDVHGYETNWSPSITVVMDNRPPDTPHDPSPVNGSNDVDSGTTLTWMGDDPDEGDVVLYDIYFGNKISPSKIVSNQSSTFFNPSLNSDTNYYWKIVSWDGYDESTSGPLWSFATGSFDGDDDDSGGGDDDYIPPVNQPPVADASASDTFGFVGSLLTFNGSLSSDPDGYITSWSWDFGDGVTKSGEVTTHDYSENGTYLVRLAVKDNNGGADNDTIYVVIGVANNPPYTPIVNGVTSGSAYTYYNYSAMSTDSDNDSISYTFDWGDGATNISDFLPNGTKYVIMHEWTEAGVYTVNVTASDGATISKKVKMVVLIDAEYVLDLGYLLDIDGDGIYDSFFSNITKIKTSVKQDGENYLIDINGDGNWNYNYDPTDGSVTSVEKEKETTGNNSIFPTEILLVMCMVLIIIFVAIYFYKK